MNAVNWSISLVIFAVLLAGFYAGYIVGKKNNIGRVVWTGFSGVRRRVLYRVLGSVNIFSNQYAVILRDACNRDYCVIVPDFELPAPEVKYITVGKNSGLETAFSSLEALDAAKRKMGVPLS